MALDGKLLARARRRLDEIKAENAAENQRRTAEVYSRVPRVREIDISLRSLFSQVLRSALDRSAAALDGIEKQAAALRCEKAEALTAAGFPADYLDELYHCEKCRDSGFGSDGRPCVCLMELYNAEQAKELSSLMQVDRDSFEQFDLSYYSTAPDLRLGISPRECMTMTLASCRDYAARFGRGAENLLLRGGTGLGKTMLSACIAKAVTAKGCSVVYDTAVSVFDAFESKKFTRDEDAEEKVRRILSCDLLILDDLGTEMTTPLTQSSLYTIVNTRLNEGRATIINTNLSKDELAARYTAQTVSRINGSYEVLPFLGSDIRAMKK